MKLPSRLRSGNHLKLIVSLALTGAIVAPFLLLGRASAVSLDIICTAQQGNEVQCDMTLANLGNVSIQSLQIDVTGPTLFQATFDEFGNILAGDSPIQEIRLLSNTPIGGDGNGYGNGDGDGYGSEPGAQRLKFRAIIDTGLIPSGDYSARFILNTGDPDDPTIESGPDSFTVEAGPPVGEPEPASTVTAQVVLQGRSDANHAGTEITLFKNGVRADPQFTTPANGVFSTDLTPGTYQLQASHAGWLSEILEFSIGTPAQARDLGTIQLAAGDADADNDVDTRDLHLFQQEFGLPPMAGVFTDINDNGLTDLVDTSYAGRNLGLSGLLATEEP